MSIDILIVEDSKTQALRLQMLLEHEGWNVEVCTTGKEAFEMISRLKPKMVVLDYRLPDMLGLQLCRQIRGKIDLRLIPVLILTDDHSEDAVLDGLESGADGFLNKNVADDVLVARIRTLIASSDEAYESNEIRSVNIKKWTVLAIDDSPSYCEIIKSELESEGFFADYCTDPTNALARLKTETYDLILTDLTLPDMDGIQVVRTIKKDARHASTAIALLTGTEDDSVVVEGLDAGADDFLFKSHSPEIIVKRCQALVRRRELITENRSLNERILEKEVQKKLAESEAQSARRMAEFKSNFLSRMSHEIRTPMNSVIGMASLLEETSLTDEQLEFIRAIKTAGETLLSIINDVLDLSKLQAGKMNLLEEEFDLVNTVSDVTEMFSEAASSKGLEMLSFVSGEVPLLVGDHLRVRQILINFVGNAMKFTDDGSISIRAEVKSQKDGKAEVLCEVTDTGIGIPDEDQDRVFDAFQQSLAGQKTKIAGTGLGLAICCSLVEAMDGEIGVRSKEGEGSTFWFTMRLASLDAKEDSPASLSQFDRKTSILMSGDDRLLDSIFAQLDSWGFQVRTARSHEDLSVEQVQESQVIVADYQTGESEIRELVGKHDKISLPEQDERAEAASDALILLGQAGHRSRDVVRETFGALKLHSILTKPINLANLRESLKKATGENPGQAQATKPRGEEQTDSSKGLKILLVDDDPANRRLGKLLAEKSGHHATLAEDGSVALELLDKDSFDIVFMDCQMPDVDGFEATRRYRAREESGKHTPIVALTAGVLDGYQTTCFDAGMDDFMAKPVTLGTFQKMLAKWFSKEDDAA